MTEARADESLPKHPEERLYRTLTPTSARYFAEACQYLPGGDSRSPLFYQPYPVVFEEGHGCRLTDVDGNNLLDFTGNHSSLVLGYGHPHVADAVQAQLAKGTCFPGGTELQLRLARLLGRRVPSLEQVRFTNSGTEATMNAVRAARAFTGRDKIAKMEGGYNGTWDEVMVSTRPPAGLSGKPEQPASVTACPGLTPHSADNVVVLPFNRVQPTAQLVHEHGEELAAIIVEPVLGSAGMIPADQSYLDALRELASRYGILLIFDEVVSFRVSVGGAQEHFGIQPDLTCLGKLIGGGFPLGVFGGRRDVMAMFDPTSPDGPQIPHPGSYNANPISLAAATATLEVLTAPMIDTLNNLGRAVRDGAQATFASAGPPAQLTGLGSLFGIHPVQHPVKDYRDATHSDPILLRRLFLGLFNEGILIDPRGVGCVSAAHGQHDVDQFLEALSRVVPRLAVDHHAVRPVCPQATSAETAGLQSSRSL